MTDFLDPAGMKVRREVLGDTHVEKSLANVTDFNRDLQKMISEHLWRDIWTREGLSRRDRSIASLAIFTALGRVDELKLHVRAALKHGLSPDEIKEVLLQATVYCGIPAGVDAFNAASSVLAEDAGA